MSSWASGRGANQVSVLGVATCRKERGKEGKREGRQKDKGIERLRNDGMKSQVIGSIQPWLFTASSMIKRVER